MEDASCLYRTASIAYIVSAISVEERFDRINGDQFGLEFRILHRSCQLAFIRIFNALE